jgi:hypothetical protein
MVRRRTDLGGGSDVVIGLVLSLRPDACSLQGRRLPTPVAGVFETKERDAYGFEDKEGRAFVLPVKLTSPVSSPGEVTNPRPLRRKTNRTATGAFGAAGRPSAPRQSAPDVFGRKRAVFRK